MLFRNEYYFLSNMYPCKISCEINGKQYNFKCSEAAFQAHKAPSRAKEFENIDGFTAKRLGRTVRMEISNWDNIKDNIMKKCLHAKFQQNPELMDKLKSTHNVHICEENTWHDTYWGVCNGRGQNKLGKMLMEIRDNKTTDP